MGGLVLVLGAGLAACGSRPALTPYAPGGVLLGDVVGLPVRPGHLLVFDVYVVDRGREPVRVTGASLISAAGARTPRLVQAGIEHGRNRVGVRGHWPPRNVHPTPLVGHDLPPGRTAIALAVTATAPGRYATLGLRLTYRDGGGTATASAYGGAALCVVPEPADVRTCNPLAGGLDERVIDQIHAGG